MACNRPQKSWRLGKKRVVKACSGGREKIIHFGATGYGHNYSPEARKSFRARHKCSSAKDKLTARYWACKELWTKGGSSKSCPKDRKCKGKSSRKSPKRKSRSRKRKSPKRKSRSRKRKSPKRKSRSRKRKSPKRKSRSSKSRSRKKKSRSSKRGKPTNMALYNSVKAQAKRKFKVWPSAYASGWLVKEYKSRGGKYSGKKSGRSHGLERWFEEKWVNVCKSPHTACGRPNTSFPDWKKKYPYCRPSIRVSGATPKTASQLSKEQIARRCKQKHKSPMRRVTSRKRKSRSRRKSRRKSRKRKSSSRKR